MTNYIRWTILFSLFILSFTGQSQKIVNKINKKIGLELVRADMMYLASDELKGRKTGEAGNQAAATYIANVFRTSGLKLAPGMNSYYQSIPFQKFIPPHDGTLNMMGAQYQVGNNLVILDGGTTQQKVEAVYADYGWIDEAQKRNDFAGLDVKGKYIIVQGGRPQGGSPQEVFASMSVKRKFAKEHGATGLIEIYNLSFPWNFFKNYFSKERLEVIEGSSAEPGKIFHAWIQLPSGSKPEFEKGKIISVEIKTSGASSAPVKADNVIGIIPGKNKKLRDEYVLLTAHFDHVGVRAGQVAGNDTIWNGARDNAWGTVGLLAAARFFSKYPPERSLMIAAVNGEEMGLLGSKYLAAHPVIPWNQVIFNLNTDGAGYSDTTLVAVIGLNRVGAADEINAGCAAFGLTTFADPAPEQGLFDRSDNVNFAILGIPAPTFGSGFKSFDAAIQKYYHQAIDNPDNLSYPYLHNFTKAFVLTSYNIAGMKNKPRWVAGDKYEAAGKKLYGY